MRATILAVCAVCVLLSIPSYAAAAAADANDAAGPDVEALGDRAPDRWNGRRHYLYDEENLPNAATVGSAPSDVRACANEPVRLRRSDGSTVVRRIKRCD